MRPGARGADRSATIFEGGPPERRSGRSNAVVASVSRRPISPQDAAGYARRWSAVRKRLVEERRAMSMETRLRRLAALMESAREMGWYGKAEAEKDALRKKWMTVRRALRGDE